MKKLANKILSYLDYLNKDCDLKVSVHFDAKTFSSFPDFFVDISDTECKHQLVHIVGFTVFDCIYKVIC